MGDMGDIFNAMREERRALRNMFGMPCPLCRKEQPKRQPTILLPGQHCRVHKLHYVDPRPRLEAITHRPAGREEG